MNRCFTFITLAVLWSIFALAGIIRVPQDQPGIQVGIDAAANGDTVLVADSTYYENINFMGKAITVASYHIMDEDTNHINNTIIDGSQPTNPDIGSVVSFVSGEDTNSVIYGFTITGGTGTLYNSNLRVGGGIHCGNSGARISHNKIVFNSVTNDQICNGGGIGHFPLNNVKHVIIEDNTIASNALYSLVGGIGGSTGGGIFLTQGRIIRNKIFLNTSTGQTLGSGGGIHVHCDTTYGRTFVKISGNTITNNQGTATNGSSNGGGIDVVFTNVEIDSNQISHNTISGNYPYGCGIRIISSKDISAVEDNIISYNSDFNSPDNSSGGGLYFALTTKLTVRGNDFINNTATWGGGICEAQTVGSIISGNRFYGNTANSDGGGTFSIGDTSTAIYNNLFANNKAVLSGGGIYLFQNSPAQIVNNTIVADTAGLYGAGIFSNSDSVIVMNTILWGNSAPDGEQIYIGSTNTQVVYSGVQGGWTGEGNIDSDPLLYDSVMTTGDTTFCCLHPNSPCIDAGNPDPDYNESEDPNNPGFSLWPSMATVRNDMGVYGGPGTSNWITGIEDELTFTEEIPTGFQLSQNYPNPFNPATTIEFTLPKTEFVTLKIYNILGEEVTTLVSENLAAGRYKYEWDSRGLTSGMYFYKLEAGKFTQSRKMLLLR